MFDGGGDVGPRSVLDEDGADDDFKGGAAGPPVLGAVGGKEGVVVGACIEGRNLRQGVRALGDSPYDFPCVRAGGWQNFRLGNRWRSRESLVNKLPPPPPFFVSADSKGL